MKRFLIVLFMLWPLEAIAQSDDRGRLQRFLEDSLSDAGREVRIEGFKGLLSSEATLETLSISDDNGVWITLSDVTLNWNRTALLRGRLEVTELSAKSLHLPRPPLSQVDNTLPPPEASGFSGFELPELPVAISIGKLAIDKVEIGAAMIGQDAVFEVTGNANLEGGAGDATLSVTRIDSHYGVLQFDGSFNNQTELLAINLSLEEGAGGLVGASIGLPGNPSVQLGLSGTGPLSAFSADVSLETDGVSRVTGTVGTALTGDARVITATLQGDLRPLIPTEHHEFFGARSKMDVASQIRGDGGLSLDRLEITSQALNMTGSLDVAPDGWPERFDLTGSLKPVSGDKLRLPGSKIETSGAEISLRFDSERGDEWSGQVSLLGLELDAISLSRIEVDGVGAIARGAYKELNATSGKVALKIEGMSFPDPSLTHAVGQSLSGSLNFTYAAKGPLTLSKIDLIGAGLELDGAMKISGLLDGLNLNVDTELALTSPDISRFSELVGRDLSGAGAFRLQASGAPLAGTFDLALAGETQRFTLGIAEVDALTGGTAQLDISARRSTAGTFLDKFALTSEHLSFDLNGDLQTGQSELRFKAALDDLERLVPGPSGLVSLTGTLQQNETAWELKTRLTAPGDILANLALSTEITNNVGPVFGNGQVQIGKLTVFSDLAKLALDGSANLAFKGSALPDGSELNATLNGAVKNLGTGITPLDKLLEGGGQIVANLSRKEDVLSVSALEIATAHAELGLDAKLMDDDLSATYSMSVKNISHLDQRIAGQASLNGKVERKDGQLSTAGRVSAPGNTIGQFSVTLKQADVSGNDVLASLNLTTTDLSAFSDLADRELGGQIDLALQGKGNIERQSFSASAIGSTQDLAISQPEADKLLAGASEFRVEFQGEKDNQISLKSATLVNKSLRADLSGMYGPDGTWVAANASLTDLGVIAPGLNGPMNLDAHTEQINDEWMLSAEVNGGGGIRADLEGTINTAGDRARLSLTGDAPLALANRIIRPNLASGQAQFDMRLDGTPSLEALAGTVSTKGATLILPGQPLAAREIDARVQIGNGSAHVDVNARLRPGGRAQVTGEVDLAGRNTASLTLDLEKVQIEQPGLLETSANGRIRVIGPLRGGARISGNIDLGPVELRVADTPGSAAAGLDGLIHNGDTAEVQRTRRYAGISDKPQQSRSTGGPSYPLDVTISAPSRIFVRGRGLDAELGGTVRLGGASNSVVPAGRFDLIRGRLDILGQRLSLVEGAAQLAGGFDPALRLLAQTNAGDTQVGVLIEGQATAPEITLTSTPSLPQDEILARLLFGKDLSQITAFQALRLAAAVRTLMGKGGEGILSKLRKGFGLDDLDVVQNPDGTTGVTAGKYISENIYSNVTTTSDGTSEINLNLDITPSLTLRGSAGSSGQTGLGVYFEKDY